MDLKSQFLRDGYTVLKRLTAAGKEVLFKQNIDKYGVATDFKIFDTPNSFRNVSREVGKYKTGWCMRKSNGLDVSTEFYPRAVSITKRGASELPYSRIDVILSEDAKNIDTIYKEWSNPSGKAVYDFAHNTKYKYFPETDRYTQLYAAPKTYTSISDILF